MKRHRLSPGPRHAKGFSLIELMVSLTIGLIIAVAAGSAYLGSAGAGRIAEAQSRMNEDAQAALNILAQQVREAGNNPLRSGDRAPALRHNPIYDPTYVGGSVSHYFDLYGTPTYVITSTAAFSVSAFSLRGCDGKFSDITTATKLDTLTCAGGTTTLPDSIAVSYEADRYNTIPTVSPTFAPTDCLGNTLDTVNATVPTGTATTATYAYTVADNRFYIGTSTAIVSPSLYCKGIGNVNPQPLVENVEDMQFTYGTVSSTNTSTTATVAGYLPADEVVTDTNLALLPIEQRWGKVLSVRICVLVRSENPVAPDADSARYDDCQGGRDVAAPDLRLRRAYSTTVVLRNRRF